VWGVRYCPIATRTGMCCRVVANPRSVRPQVLKLLLGDRRWYDSVTFTCHKYIVDPLQPTGDDIYHLLSTLKISVFYLQSVFARSDN
jgi:hypothetical protein